MLSQVDLKSALFRVNAVQSQCCQRVCQRCLTEYGIAERREPLRDGAKV
jgi:hypothetical protein